MKRLTRKQRERLLRRLKTLLRSRRRRIRRVRSSALAIQRRGPTSTKALRIYAPVVFDIFDPRARTELLAFLDQLRQAFKSCPAEKVLIDFSKTNRFVAAGTLLFYAELCRLVEYSPRTVIRCTQPVGEKAKQVLQQIGVFGLCQNTYRGKATHSDVVHWKVARGHVVDATQYAETLEVYEGMLAEPLMNGIYRGLAEAMTNVCHHAYIEERDDGLEYSGTKDWWVFSQAKDGFLYVALCDLGVGIPGTLPTTNPGLFGRVKDIIKMSPKDSDYINAAIQDSRSRTHLPERGKGLGDIVQAVAQVANGRASVCSNRGWYTLTNGQESSGDFRDSLCGTLVTWKVPILAKSL